MNKFFEFSQNNCGGFFDTDENVCHRVVIEAESEQQAILLFEPMIEWQSYSCSCCGDRWHLSPDEIEIEAYKTKGYPVGVYSHYPNAEERWGKLFGEFPLLECPSWQTKYGSKKFEGKVYFDSIEQYCQFMANEYGWTKPDVIINYLDGSKKQIFKKEI